MFIKTETCSGSGVTIFGYGYTDPEFDSRLTRVDQKTFLTNYIPDESKEIIFGHPAPFTDDEIDREVKKTLEKIGCNERTFFAGTNHELAFIAAKKCIDSTGLLLSQIDAIIVGTNTGPGYPSLADYLKNELSLHYGDKSWTAMCYDMTEACTAGSIAVLHGYSLIKSRICKNVLVVLSEKATKLADPNVWIEANLFGDAAGAFLLTESKKDSFIFFDINSMPGDGNLSAIYKNEDNFFKQDTKKVHRFVGGTVGRMINSALDQAKIKPSEIDHIIAHQPSSKTLNFLEQYTKDNLPGFQGEFHWDLEGMGNTSSASTVVLMSKLLTQHKIKAGEKILFITFGAGTSVGIYLYEHLALINF